MYNLPSENQRSLDCQTNFMRFNPIAEPPVAPSISAQQMFTGADMNLYDVRHPRWYKRLVSRCWGAPPL